MSPKTGRPKAENPKSIRFSIRLDKTLNDKLLQYCADNCISKGEAIRIAITKLLGE